MPDEFKPAGAILVVVGEIRNSDEPNAPVRTSLNIQAQGECEKLQHHREGLQQMQTVLMEAAAALGRAMLVAPGQAEIDDKPKVKIVQGHRLPPMPKGFRM